MIDYDSDSNIIACSSGSNANVAITIIRISGSDILNEISPFISIKAEKIKPRYAHFCKIHNDGKVFDEIVLTFFKGPNSYNGEDVVEISAHGNLINVERIISLFVENTSIRRAFPGEFTYRAMKNNKLSLSQVEGLDLLLNASSVFSLDQGFSLLSGKLQENYLQLHRTFLEHRASLELGFDFLDDIGEEAFSLRFKETLSDLKLSVSKLYSSISNSGANLLKPEIALVGLPNAGKSSLFNSLINDERSIVSNIEGTTRDYVSEDICIDKNIFKLIDTAGIRNSSDIIEEKGVEMALKLVSKSFFKVLVINPFNLNEEYFKKLSHLSFDAYLFSHQDLDGFDSARVGALSFLSNIFGPTEPINSGPIEPIVLSMNLTSRLDTDLLLNRVNSKYLGLISSNPIIIERHSDQIAEIYKSITEYQELTLFEEDISIIGSELNIVGNCISELIGIISPDDILKHIFTNFCIGK